MTLVSEVEIAPLPPARYESILAPKQAREFHEALFRAQATFGDRRIWNVNSTARGGGVAEMLRSLVAYARGAGVDARWAVITGNTDFFTITKRIHNRLHNFDGDGGPLGETERRLYEASLEANCREICAMVRPGDIVVLHDPQTAGLIPRIKETGVPVVWRCHLGIDTPGEAARQAWSFLIDYVRQADRCVFSRRGFAWDGLDNGRVALIAPSIDAFAPKNSDMDPGTVRAVLVSAGLMAGPAEGRPIFLREDGRQARVERRATVLETEPIRGGTATVLQVSRWDRLKDPIGVIRGFAEHIAPRSDAHLVYAGPAVEAVSDDPEGREVLDEAIALWRGLADDRRSRIHLATLPMVDGDENAAMVNALQRNARVVVQKSVAEGFGLTVAEAMWKGKPVVASRIGGIQDQIEDGRSGLLLDDPTDLARYGQRTLSLLEDEGLARTIGAAAMERVRDEFLGARSLLQFLRLFADLLSPARAPGR